MATQNDNGDEFLVRMLSIIDPNGIDFATSDNIQKGFSQLGIQLSDMEIKNREDMEEACKRIRDLGALNVLLKGGHSDNPYDLFFDGESFCDFEGEKYKDKRVHGTGCALSAAICAGVAKGKPLGDSIAEAKKFINEIIPKSQNLGKGDMDFMIIN